MFFITQLIYLKAGQEAVFDPFENAAIPIIQKYKGRLLLRVRPSADHFIEQAIEAPYEIHLIEFEHQTDFERFMQDKERQSFLHLKEQSIRSSILFHGQQS